jgi:hypothetical protein
MYVWRFPVLSFAILVVTSGLVAVLLLLIELRARNPNSVIRGLLTSTSLLALLASPALVGTLTERELRLLAEHGVWRHYGPQVFAAPLVFAALLLVAAYALFPSREVESQPLKWRFYFLATCLGFSALNLINWCSPGWCERFGFPFPYSWWSDAVLIMNGRNITAGTSKLGLAMNIAILLVSVVLLARSFRRRAVEDVAR